MTWALKRSLVTVARRNPLCPLFFMLIFDITRRLSALFAFEVDNMVSARMSQFDTAKA